MSAQENYSGHFGPLGDPRGGHSYPSRSAGRMGSNRSSIYFVSSHRLGSDLVNRRVRPSFLRSNEDPQTGRSRTAKMMKLYLCGSFRVWILSTYITLWLAAPTTANDLFVPFIVLTVVVFVYDSVGRIKRTDDRPRESL